MRMRLVVKLQADKELGILIKQGTGGGAVVVGCKSQTQAEKLGIRAGDRVAEVLGQNVESKSAVEVVRLLGVGRQRCIQEGCTPLEVVLLRSGPDVDAQKFAAPPASQSSWSGPLTDARSSANNTADGLPAALLYDATPEAADVGSVLIQNGSAAAHTRRISAFPVSAAAASTSSNRSSGSSSNAAAATTPGRKAAASTAGSAKSKRAPGGGAAPEDTSVGAATVAASSASKPWRLGRPTAVTPSAAGRLRSGAATAGSSTRSVSRGAGMSLHATSNHSSAAKQNADGEVEILVDGSSGADTAARRVVSISLPRGPQQPAHSVRAASPVHPRVTPVMAPYSPSSPAATGRTSPDAAAPHDVSDLPVVEEATRLRHTIRLHQLSEQVRALDRQLHGGSAAATAGGSGLSVGGSGPRSPRSRLQAQREDTVAELNVIRATLGLPPWNAELYAGVAVAPSSTVVSSLQPTAASSAVRSGSSPTASPPLAHGQYTTRTVSDSAYRDTGVSLNSGRFHGPSSPVAVGRFDQTSKRFTITLAPTPAAAQDALSATARDNIAVLGPELVVSTARYLSSVAAAQARSTSPTRSAALPAPYTARASTASAAAVATGIPVSYAYTQHQHQHQHQHQQQQHTEHVPASGIISSYGAMANAAGTSSSRAQMLEQELLAATARTVPLSHSYTPGTMHTAAWQPSDAGVQAAVSTSLRTPARPPSLYHPGTATAGAGAGVAAAIVHAPSPALTVVNPANGYVVNAPVRTDGRVAASAIAAHPTRMPYHPFTAAAVPGAPPPPHATTSHGVPWHQSSAVAPAAPTAHPSRRLSAVSIASGQLQHDRRGSNTVNVSYSGLSVPGIVPPPPPHSVPALGAAGYSTAQPSATATTSTPSRQPQRLSGSVGPDADAAAVLTHARAAAAHAAEASRSAHTRATGSTYSPHRPQLAGNPVASSRLLPQRHAGPVAAATPAATSAVLGLSPLPTTGDSSARVNVTSQPAEPPAAPAAAAYGKDTRRRAPPSDGLEATPARPQML